MELIKVLIIEDQDSYVKVIKGAIINREIIIAKTADEALEVLKKNEFDVIAIDNCFEEVVLSMTDEQKQKTIIYTRTIGSLTTPTKADLRTVIKNHVKVLELAAEIA